MPLIKDDKSLMLRCRCHSHLLEIQTDNVWIDNGSIPDFLISFWKNHPYPFSFRHRLSLIWRLIKGETLSGDDVIINDRDAQAIIDFLTRQLAINNETLEKHKSND